MTRLTPEDEAGYALDYGVSKGDLSPGAQAEYDRLLEDRRAGRVRQPQPPPPPPPPPSVPPQPAPSARPLGLEPFGHVLRQYAPEPWMEPLMPRSVERRLYWRAVFPYRDISSRRYWLRRGLPGLGLSLVVSLTAAGFAWFHSTPLTDREMNLPALRQDLAMIHFPPGYRLAVQRTKGVSAGCPDGKCWALQTWEWNLGSHRTASAACEDTLNALAAAYGEDNMDGSSATSGQTACNWDAIAPGPGKPNIQAVVKTGQANASNGFAIYLTAFYFS